MSTFIAQTATHTVTTTPAVNGGVEVKTSIRQIIMQGILQGRPKAEVEQAVIAHAPESAAAKKFSKHYAWYKGTMKKEGLLKDLVPAAAVPQTIAELEAQIARLKALLTALDTDEAAAAVSEADRIAQLAAEMAAKVDAAL